MPQSCASDAWKGVPQIALKFKSVQRWRTQFALDLHLASSSRTQADDDLDMILFRWHSHIHTATFLLIWAVFAPGGRRNCATLELSGARQRATQKTTHTQGSAVSWMPIITWHKWDINSWWIYNLFSQILINPETCFVESVALRRAQIPLMWICHTLSVF